MLKQIIAFHNKYYTEAINSGLRFVGFVSSLCAALLGQSDLIGEPWRHWITIAGIIASVTFAYFQQPPRNPNSQDRIDDKPQADRFKELTK